MGRRSSRSGSGSCSSSERGRRRPRETGTINTWNKEKQFGFVSCNSRNRPDLFVHAEYIENVDQRYKAKNRGLRRGDKIAFDIQEPRPASGKKSAEAVNVELLELMKRSPTRSGSPDRRREAPRPQPAMEIRAGDWDCPQCGDHQFARNTECRRCKAPKPLNGLHESSRGRSGRNRSRSRRRSPSRRRRSPSPRRSTSRRRSPSFRRSNSRRKSPSRRRSRSRHRSRTPSRRRSRSRRRSQSRR